MEGYEAKELDYGINMAVNTLVQAMGMHWENEQRLANGESIAYSKEHFDDLINENGIHHNGVLSRWRS